LTTTRTGRHEQHVQAVGGIAPEFRNYVAVQGSPPSRSGNGHGPRRRGRCCCA
jgi:hypothetical protein